MRVALAAVWAIFLAVGIVQAANGLQTDLLAVRGGLEAFQPWSIGLFMAGYYVGYSTGPLLAPALVRRIGHVGLIAASLSVAAVAILAHAFLVSLTTWTVLRACSGLALSSTYVAMESWINDRTENRVRGRVFGVYMVMQMLGMTFAQVLLSAGNPGTAWPFALAAMMFLIGIGPVFAFRAGAPHRAPPEPFGVLRLFQVSPLGALTTMLAGVSWSIVFTFGPVYAQHEGFDLAGVGLFMGVAVAASAVFQFPLGWLSDHAGRRVTIALMCAFGTVAALFGVWCEQLGETAKITASAMTGGLVFPLYGLSVAHTNDHVAPQSRVAAAAGLVLLFGLGSIAGPLMTGWMMNVFGPPAFFAAVAATMISSVAVCLSTR